MNTRHGSGRAPWARCGLLPRAVLLWLVWLAAPAALANGWPGQVLAGLEPTGLQPAQLGVVVNEADPLSLRIGEYYAARRGIPETNVLRVRFEPGRPSLPRKRFEQLYAELRAATPAGVQAYALTWAEPYRVDCMSITTAFTAGFDPAFCARGCKPTRPSPYFDSATRAPAEQLGWRPSMLIAARDFEQARALIDRGIAADGSFPVGTAYLLSTSDKARNTRAARFPAARQRLASRFIIEVRQADSLGAARDVMFYFTGLARVPDLGRLRFLPGAVADHLTSAGGQLTDSPQMSALRWLEAGATGSYGAVLEPCNFPQKFPDPEVLMRRYLDGETLVEAYWKSVAWPGQGLFIGEPLARPFGFGRD